MEPYGGRDQIRTAVLFHRQPLLRRNGCGLRFLRRHRTEKKEGNHERLCPYFPHRSTGTTLAKELECRGYEQILAYTTRPPRDNEIEGVDYHFVTDAEFEDAFLDGELTCVRTYSTVFGVWKYAFAWSDLYRAVDSVAVIDPESYLRIYDQIENVFGIYLDVPNDVRKARLLVRGDDPKEIDRRMQADVMDFTSIDMCFRDVCKMRIGMVRRPDIEADRIEGHVREFRSQIFRGENMAYDEESNL